MQETVLFGARHGAEPDRTAMGRAESRRKWPQCQKKMEKPFFFRFFPDHTFRVFPKPFFLSFFLTAGQGPFYFQKN